MSAIDPTSEWKGEAYPLRLSESVPCLLLAADGAERTDDWEETDVGGRRREGGMLRDSWTIERRG